jgi:hypothetical protein
MQMTHAALAGGRSDVDPPPRALAARLACSCPSADLRTLRPAKKRGTTESGDGESAARAVEPTRTPLDAEHSLRRCAQDVGAARRRESGRSPSATATRGKLAHQSVGLSATPPRVPSTQRRQSLVTKSLHASSPCAGCGVPCSFQQICAGRQSGSHGLRSSRVSAPRRRSAGCSHPLPSCLRRRAAGPRGPHSAAAAAAAAPHFSSRRSAGASDGAARPLCLRPAARFGNATMSLAADCTKRGRRMRRLTPCLVPEHARS